MTLSRFRGTMETNKYIKVPMLVYPPEGCKLIICSKCNIPCAVDVDEKRDTCLMCIINNMDDK